MKKALIIGLMALTATFASAVTVSWTESNPGGTSSNWQNGSYNKSVSSSVTSGVCNSASVVACITSADSPNNKSNVIQINLGTAGTISYRVCGSTESAKGNMITIDQSSSSNAAVANTTLTSDKISMTGNTKYILSAIFTKTDDSTVSGKFYVNDTLIAYGDYAATQVSVGGYWSWDNLGSFYTIDDMTGYEGALTDAERNALVGAGTSNLASVPEPTVLALLALGVAGLALKRRV